MKYVFIVFSSLLFFTVQAQDYNLDFEKWNNSLSFIPIKEDAAFPQCYNFLLGNAVQVENSGPHGQEILSGWIAESRFGLTRTTDAYSGDFAAIVHMWYNGSPGHLSLGSCPGSPYPPTCKIHLNSKLYGISGFYKYLVDSLVPNDTYQKVTMMHLKTYKINPSTNTLDVLTYDSLLYNRIEQYTEFYLPISYVDSNSIPDSISLWFESKGYNSGVTYCHLSHFLYLDDLKFHYEPYTLSVNLPKVKKQIKIFPNPATNKIILEYGHDLSIQFVKLINILGEEIAVYEGSEKVLSLPSIAAGLYMLHFQTSKGKIIEKFFIQ